MRTILIDKKYNSFIDEYSKKLDLGGFSNLAKEDLNKASRRDFQITGLAGEISWNLYRYGSIDLMHSRLDKKLAIYYNTGKGDGGFDDNIVYDGKERFVDIKASHCKDEEKIKYLNLIIPQREYHDNLIYVCAFTIGKDRLNIDRVILAGWALTEDIKKRWFFDNTKWCVPVNELRDIKDLDIFIK